MVLTGGAAWLVSLLFASQLPERMATHFDTSGTPDGYTPKLGFYAMFVGLVIILPLFLKFVTKLDPNQENINKAVGAINVVRWVLTLFSIVVCYAIIAYNLGYPLMEGKWALVAVGFLFFTLGNLMPRFRQNWFIGVRTPWTMVNEAVWRKTQRLTGYLWCISGVVLIAAAFIIPAGWSIGVVITVITASSLVPYVYSYLVFRQEGGKA